MGRRRGRRCAVRRGGPERSAEAGRIRRRDRRADRARAGTPPEFVQVTFTSFDQSVVRGDFDIGLSGIEDTPGRRAAVGVSIPYYRFTEGLTVRADDRDRFRTLADMRGRRVATLGGTIAYEILLQAARDHGITAVSYDDDVHPYSDTLAGRVDAVLLDNVLAARAMSRHAGLVTQPDAVAAGHYVVIVSPENTALHDRVDDILRRAMADGRLEAIFYKWHVWNDEQPALFAAVLNGALEPDARHDLARRRLRPRFRLTRRSAGRRMRRRRRPSVPRAVGAAACGDPGTAGGTPAIPAAGTLRLPASRPPLCL